jgi:hypothetical protein
VRAALLVALSLAAGCSSRTPWQREAPPPRSGPPVYRCAPEGDWQPVTMGEKLHCPLGGDVVCPGGCDLFYQWASGDDTWGRAGWNRGRAHPQGLWQAYTYVVAPVGASPPGPLWTPPAKAASTTTTAAALATHTAAALAH